MINVVTKLLIFLIFIAFNTYICFYAEDKTAGIVTACIGSFLAIAVVTIGFGLRKTVREDEH